MRLLTIISSALVGAVTLLASVNPILATQGASQTESISIGLIVPDGKPEAEEMLHAAQLALASSALKGSGSQLRQIPSELQWGKQTTEITNSIYTENISILVGAPDPRTAHLVAQVIARSKGSVLFFSLSEDPTLTQLGVPWIYRLLPPKERPAATSAGESLASFRQQFRQRAGSDPTALAVAAYEAVHLAATLQRDYPDLPSVQKALSTKTFQGLSATFTFDKSGNRK